MLLLKWWGLSKYLAGYTFFSIYWLHWLVYQQNNCCSSRIDYRYNFDKYPRYHPTRHRPSHCNNNIQMWAISNCIESSYSLLVFKLRQNTSLHMTLCNPQLFKVHWNFLFSLSLYYCTRILSLALLKGSIMQKRKLHSTSKPFMHTGEPF